MIVNIKRRDVKELSNLELIEERNELFIEIQKKDEEWIKVPICLFEDDLIIYKMNLERLLEILAEINKRTNLNKWLVKDF